MDAFLYQVPWGSEDPYRQRWGETAYPQGSVWFLEEPSSGGIIQTSYFICCIVWLHASRGIWELMLSMYSFRWSPCWWTSWFGPRSWTVQLCPTGYFLLKWLMISPGKPAEHTYLCMWGHCSCNWFVFIGSMQVLCVGDSSFHHPEDEQARAEDSERVGWGKRKAGEATQQKGRENYFCLLRHLCTWAFV